MSVFKLVTLCEMAEHVIIILLVPASYLVSTMMGSTETTFYILAVYFGSVQIRHMRHALAVGLIAEIAGIFASIVAVKMLFFS